MHVIRHLSIGQGYCVGSAQLTKPSLSQTRSPARMHGCGSLEIGEGKSRSSIAAIGSAYHCEESGVLSDMENLPVAKAQLRGAKLPANILTSAIKGSLILSSWFRDWKIPVSAIIKCIHKKGIKSSWG